MAKKTLIMNQALGFDGEKFELKIKKPSDNWGLIEHERKVNGKVTFGRSEESKISDELGVRFKRTIEAFLNSSYEELIIIGKLIEKSE